MKAINQEILMQVENLLNVGIALSAEKDPNLLLEMIVSEARGICNADAGTLFQGSTGTLFLLPFFKPSSSHFNMHYRKEAKRTSLCFLPCYVKVYYIILYFPLHSD